MYRNFPCFSSSNVTLIGVTSGKDHITTPIYFTFDGLIISGITFLQILKIWKSNASRTTASKNTDKKITSFNMQVMLLFCCFNIPHVIADNLRASIQDRLIDNGKSWIEFSAEASLVMICTNSFVNAVLFLTTNVKAKRVLRSLEN